MCILFVYDIKAPSENQALPEQDLITFPQVWTQFKKKKSRTKREIYTV